MKDPHHIIYLTDTIFLKEDKLYYNDPKGVMKDVKTHNWHHILSECGWSKINKRWITLLNKESRTRQKNSLYGILDCESDGNCFFHCIANALNEKGLYLSEYYDQNDIRHMLADSITEEKYKELLHFYKIMKDADDFDEEWDPYSIESIEDFKTEITKSGHNYWGDWLLLDVLCKALEINIFILNTDTLNNNFTIYNTMIDYQSNFSSIFLSYEDLSHFQLVGYFNGDKITSYFAEKQIPRELKKICKIIR
jgi:hypothetical protein